MRTNAARWRVYFRPGVSRNVRDKCWLSLRATGRVAHNPRSLKGSLISGLGPCKSVRSLGRSFLGSVAPRGPSRRQAQGSVRSWVETPIKGSFGTNSAKRILRLLRVYVRLKIKASSCKARHAFPSESFVNVLLLIYRKHHTHWYLLANEMCILTVWATSDVEATCFSCAFA